eukprot:2425334-Rhodomonas_salina.1
MERVAVTVTGNCIVSLGVSRSSSSRSSSPSRWAARSPRTTSGFPSWSWGSGSSAFRYLSALKTPSSVPEKGGLTQRYVLCVQETYMYFFAITAAEEEEEEGQRPKRNRLPAWMRSAGGWSDVLNGVGTGKFRGCRSVPVSDATPSADLVPVPVPVSVCRFFCLPVRRSVSSALHHGAAAGVCCLLTTGCSPAARCIQVCLCRQAPSPKTQNPKPKTKNPKPTTIPTSVPLKRDTKAQRYVVAGGSAEGAALPLVLQHWFGILRYAPFPTFVILRYASKTAYIVILLLLEAFFEWSILSNWEC